MKLPVKAIMTALKVPSVNQIGGAAILSILSFSTSITAVILFLLGNDFKVLNVFNKEFYFIFSTMVRLCQKKIVILLINVCYCLETSCTYRMLRAKLTRRQLFCKSTLTSYYLLFGQQIYQATSVI